MNNISQVSTAAANNLNAFNGGLGGNTAGSQAAPQQAAPQQELIECQCYNCGHTITLHQALQTVQTVAHLSNGKPLQKMQQEV